LGDDGILLEQIQDSSVKKTISFNRELDYSPAYRQSFKGVWTDGQTTKDFEISKLVEYASINYRQGDLIDAKEIFPRFLESGYEELNSFIQNQAQKDQYDFFSEGFFDKPWFLFGKLRQYY